MQDAGALVSVRATPPAASGAPARESAALGPICFPATEVTVPTVSGAAVVGKTLTAAAGTLPSGTALSYQWLRNGKSISTAGGSSSTLASADVGRTISVKVTASRSAYKTLSKTSAQVRPSKAASKPKPASNRANPVGNKCPASHPIKGNANSGSYHVPSGADYSRTVPDECFKTEAAAKAAGYRKSKP